MTQFKIQTEIVNIGIYETEIFTDEQMAVERFHELKNSAKKSGVDVEITFDIFEK